MRHTQPHQPFTLPPSSSPAVASERSATARWSGAARGFAPAGTVFPHKSPPRPRPRHVCACVRAIPRAHTVPPPDAVGVNSLSIKLLHSFAPKNAALSSVYAPPKRAHVPLRPRQGRSVFFPIDTSPQRGPRLQLRQSAIPGPGGRDRHSVFRIPHSAIPIPQFAIRLPLVIPRPSPYNM